MSSLHVDVVTTERRVYSGEAEAVIAPGAGGQLGILPHHAPLMTSLTAGELIIRSGGNEEILAISGGFLEVRPDHVIVLADQAERATEIDLERAVAARQRAEERLKVPQSGIDLEKAEAALKRALVRLAVADRVKTRKNSR